MARPRLRQLLSLLAVAAFAFSEPALAIEGRATPESTIDPSMMQVDEAGHLGDPVPRDLPLLDSAGREFRLGDMMGKPLILLLSYYTCDGTCPTINKSLNQALAGMGRFQVGRDYRILTVSFDQQDSAATAAHFVQMTEIPAAIRDGWRHAVARNPDGIGILTASTGFKYFWSRADQVFVHPNVVIFLTPDGRVARYLYGVNLDPETVKLALIDADWGRISNTTQLMDILTGVCYSYNFKDGTYNYNYSLLIGGCSMLFGITLVIFSTTGSKRKKLGGFANG